MMFRSTWKPASSAAYQAHLEKTISTVCCGWVNRGVAIGEGKFFGGLDGKIVALYQNGKETWSAGGTLAGLSDHQRACTTTA